MDKKNLKPNTNYWINIAGIEKERDIVYRNHEGSWCLDIGETRKFLSDYKMELIYGKNFVIREVDFLYDTLCLDIKQTAFKEPEDQHKLITEFINNMLSYKIDFVEVLYKKRTGSKDIIGKYDVKNEQIIFSNNRIKRTLAEVLKEDAFLFFNREI